ncbi:acetyl-CoA hydrolase/transferase C-terminal domain-containing protein [Simiduia curdlanivorans]|uniref:Acetyl-CoA hydrolase/transferase C-terminal domain-containing protein n=1 Tax=Simiduia curdlanivorans TaxID=1492769 RepID=A0ABV8V8P7_9GAMM|nr:acetyl-CoA hydrolase/transferase C-terminal domain-containing protein [Simiduia curdlanivorans]MDN3639381.1 acetyl-CoA hydrolase/transferase C-terminal domain-containing protein [Simiduia curdlanivorans]
MKQNKIYNQLDDVVAEIFARVGKHLVLAAPLGIGKPNRLLNALYLQVKAQPETASLTLYTALSLDIPSAKNWLQQRFLAPFVARHFGVNYPVLAYVQDREQGALAANVRVHEFYFSPGSQMANPVAQQNYICQNYTHVARDLADAGVNVIVQQVARRGERVSLGSNPDVTLDLIERLGKAQQPCLVVAVVNPQMPYLSGEAERSINEFDLLLDDGGAGDQLYALPREAISATDHAIGLYASSLVKDGGTLQVGIGALSDAIANALITRHQHNADYQAALSLLAPTSEERALSLRIGGTSPFVAGLYGATEIVMDSFMHLRKAGVLVRQVYDNIALQKLLDDDQIRTPLRDEDTALLIGAGIIESPLNLACVQRLQSLGLLPLTAKLQGERLVLNDEVSLGLDLAEPDNIAQLSRLLTGQSLQGGRYLEGAFFLGSKPFYQWLGALAGDEWRGINMQRVSQVNELYGGQEMLDRVQRKQARFFNSCMLHTLLGAAASDGIEDGRVVSGVGGQYNFVAMAHALDDGRSVIMLRASRVQDGRAVSNIRWQYGHVTIPRHLRDIVITEYGIADLRGQCDEEVIKRLLAISDARFHAELLASAKAAGKLAADFEPPALWSRNLPARVAPLAELPAFSRYPFGSDFDALELRLIEGLSRLQARFQSPVSAALLILRSLLPARGSADVHQCLARLELTRPKSLREWFAARMLARLL